MAVRMIDLTNIANSMDAIGWQRHGAGNFRTGDGLSTSACISYNFHWCMAPAGFTQRRACDTSVFQIIMLHVGACPREAMCILSSWILWYNSAAWASGHLAQPTCESNAYMNLSCVLVTWHSCVHDTCQITSSLNMILPARLFSRLRF